MGAAAGPNVVEDGLVLALDAGNVKSNSEISVKWNNVIADATTVSSVGVITCLTVHQSASNFFGQKYSSCLISGSTVWDNRPPSVSDMNEILSGNLTCKSYQTGTYNQVQYLFGATPNAGDCCTLRFTGFGVGAVIGVGGYFNAFDRQCRLTGDLRNSPVTITSPSGGFADPIVLTSDPADIKFSSASSGSDPWYVYWLGPYNQVPYNIRSNPGYVIGATYSSDDGGALVFDGTDDYILLDSGLGIGTDDFAISVWVKFDSVSGASGSANYRTVLSSYSGGNGYIFGLWISGNPVFEHYMDGTSYKGNTTIVADTWYNMVSTRLSGDLYLYLNGSLDNTPVSASTKDMADTATPRIGWIPSASQNGRLDGTVSNLKVYKGKGLTAAEVQQNYNALKGRYGL